MFFDQEKQPLPLSLPIMRLHSTLMDYSDCMNRIGALYQVQCHSNNAGVVDGFI